MIANQQSEGYKLAVELERTLLVYGKDVMNLMWSQYVDRRATEGKPIKLWEQAANADTVRGLAREVAA